MACCNSKLRNERLSAGSPSPLLFSSLSEGDNSEDAKTPFECSRGAEETVFEYLTPVQREILKYYNEMVAKTNSNFRHRKKLSTGDYLRKLSRFSLESRLHKSPRCRLESSIRNKSQNCSDVGSRENLDSSFASLSESMFCSDEERDKACLDGFLAKLHQAVNADEKGCLANNSKLRFASMARHKTLMKDESSGKTDAFHLASCLQNTSDERRNGIISEKCGRLIDRSALCGCREQHRGEATARGQFSEPTDEELNQELLRSKSVQRSYNDNDEKFSKKVGSLCLEKPGRTASRVRSKEQNYIFNNLPHNASSEDNENHNVEVFEVNQSTLRPSVVDHSPANLKRSGLYSHELPGAQSMKRTPENDSRSTAAFFDLFLKLIQDKCGLNFEVSQPLHSINQNSEISRVPCSCTNLFRDAATQCAPDNQFQKKNACTQTSSAFQTCEKERSVYTLSDCSKSTANSSKTIGVDGRSLSRLYPRLGVTEKAGTNVDCFQHILPAIEKYLSEICSKTIPPTDYSKDEHTSKKNFPHNNVLETCTPIDLSCKSNSQENKGTKHATDCSKDYMSLENKGTKHATDCSKDYMSLENKGTKHATDCSKDYMSLENKGTKHATDCSKDFMSLENKCRLQATICLKRLTSADCSNKEIASANCDSPLYQVIGSKRRASTGCSRNYFTYENDSRLKTKVGSKRLAQRDSSNAGLLLAIKESPSHKILGSKRRSSANCIANYHSSDDESRLQAKLSCNRLSSPDSIEGSLAPERASSLQANVDSKRPSSTDSFNDYPTQGNKYPKVKIGSKRRASNDPSNNHSLDIGSKRRASNDPSNNHSLDIGSKRRASNDPSNNHSLDILSPAKIDTKNYITPDVFESNSQPGHRPKRSHKSGTALEKDNAKQRHYLQNHLAMISDVSRSNVNASDTNVLINEKSFTRHTSMKELPICQSPITIKLKNCQTRQLPISEENDNTTYEEGVDVMFETEKNTPPSNLSKSSKLRQTCNGNDNVDNSGTDLRIVLKPKKYLVNLRAADCDGGGSSLTSSQNNCDLVDVEDDGIKTSLRSSTDKLNLPITTSNRKQDTSCAEHETCNLGDDQIIVKHFQHGYDKDWNKQGFRQLITPFVEEVAGALSGYSEEHSGAQSICNDHLEGGIGQKSLNSTLAEVNHYIRGRFSPRDSHEKLTSDCYYKSVGFICDLNEKYLSNRLNYSGNSSSGMLVSSSNNDCYHLRSKHMRKISNLAERTSPRCHDTSNILSEKSSSDVHCLRDAVQHTMTEKDVMEKLYRSIPNLSSCRQSPPEQLEHSSTMTEETEVEFLSGSNDDAISGIVRTEHDSLEQTSLISESTEAALLGGVDNSTNFSCNKTSDFRLDKPYFETRTAVSNAENSQKSLSDDQKQQHPGDESDERNEWNEKDIGVDCNIFEEIDDTEITVSSCGDQHETSDETKWTSNELNDFYNDHKISATPISISGTSTEGKIGDENFTDRKCCNLKPTISALEQFHSILGGDTDSRRSVCNTVIKPDVGETSIVKHDSNDLDTIFSTKSYVLCSAKDICEVESLDVTSGNEELVTAKDSNLCGENTDPNTTENTDPNTTLLSYKTDDSSIESTVLYSDDGCHKQSNDIFNVPSEPHDRMESSMESVVSSLGPGTKSSTKARVGDESSESVVCLDDEKCESEKEEERENCDQSGPLPPYLSSAPHYEQESSPSRDNHCGTTIDDVRKYASSNDDWQSSKSCTGDSNNEVPFLSEDAEMSSPQMSGDSCSKASNQSEIDVGDFNTSFNECTTRQTAQQMRANNGSCGDEKFILRQAPQKNSLDLSISNSKPFHFVNPTEQQGSLHGALKRMLKSDTDCISLRSKYLGNGLCPSNESLSPSGYTSFHNSGFESRELLIKAPNHFDEFGRRKPNAFARYERVCQSRKLFLVRSMSTTIDTTDDTVWDDEAQDLSAYHLEHSANEDANVTHISNKIDSVRLEASSVTSELEVDSFREESEIDYSSEDIEVDYSREEIEADHSRNVNEVEPAREKIVVDPSCEESEIDRSREGSEIINNSRHESNETISFSVEVTDNYDGNKSIREVYANSNDKSIEEVSGLPGNDIARSYDEYDHSNVKEEAGVSDQYLLTRTLSLNLQSHHHPEVLELLEDYYPEPVVFLQHSGLNLTC